MAGITITWKPKGLLKLDGLIREALQGALEKMGSDLAKPKGGGMGVKVNSLSFEVSSSLATVESSLVWPRTTGETWLARSLSEAEGVAVEHLQAAGESIVLGVGV